MRNKNIIGFLGIFLCILFIQVTPNQGVNFKIEDEIADITYHNNSTEGNPGPSVHSEIDIEYLEIDGTSIYVSFVETPLNDSGYEYGIRIYWVGDDIIGNWTKSTWSNTHNQVHTRIENSTGGQIIDEYEYGVVEPSGTILVIPLYHTAMIPTVLDPHIVAVYVQYTVTAGEFYHDELDYATGTAPFPGFTFWLAVSGISLIVMVSLKIKKKKS